MKSIHVSSIFAGIAVLLSISACGEREAEPAAAGEPSTDAAAIVAAEQPAALPPRTASPVGATVFFITPADGDTVSSPVTIEFGLEGMNVVAAGVNEAHSGHHHLLVDTDPPDMGLPIPADENHIHFGDASTSTALTLEPGEHTLRLLLGDHLHIPHNPPIMSDTITITIE
jgi:hypothetical protein